MAASKVQASKVADSIKALMAALDDEVLPNADELRKDGWITAADYALESNRGAKTAKMMLDKSGKIKKRLAKQGNGKVMMYKA